MDAEKRKRLEAKGWKLGTAAEFLQLTPEEEKFIELRLALSRSVRETRISTALTQAQLAQRIGSSQSRVAKIEAGDPSVSLDLTIRSLLAMGISLQELASVIQQSGSTQT